MAAAVYKVLEQSAPTATTETTLYTVPAGTQVIGSKLFLCNITHLTTEATITVTVRLRPNGIAAANKHIIVPGIRIAARTAPIITGGMTLDAADIISIQTDVANGLAVTLFGTEIA